jgi:hypothetical protein
VSVAGGPDIVENGLVLYLDAANRRSYPGSGTSWVDLSGNGNTGTLTNGPTFDGENGGSISFDGVNDYIDFSTAFAAGKSELTFCAWVQPTATNAQYHIFSEGNGAFWQYTITTQAWYTRDSSTGASGGRNNDISTNFFTINVWNYMSAVYSVAGGFKKFYINGEERSQTTTSVDALTTARSAPATSRIAFPTDGVYFSGKIATPVLYNRALTAQEILQNYNATRSRFNI